MTPFDIVVLCVVGISALYALSRGFVTELLSLAAWVGALIMVRFLFTPVSQWLRTWFDSPALADVAALVGTFAVSFALLRWVATFAGGKVKDSPLGPVDRLGGALFGMVRGLLVVSLAYLALGLLVDEADFPDWIATAKTQPIVSSSAQVLRTVTAAVRDRRPGDPLLPGMPWHGQMVPDGEGRLDPLQDPADGYTDAERRALDELLRQEEAAGNARKI